MDRNDKLKETNIKSRICYFFDDINNIINFEDFDLDIILIDEKFYGNILVYGISYKFFIDAEPLRIRSDKTDGFIRVHDEFVISIIWR